MMHRSFSSLMIRIFYQKPKRFFNVNAAKVRVDMVKIRLLILYRLLLIFLLGDTHSESVLVGLKLILNSRVDEL